MTEFKKLFETRLNEGTNATITVLNDGVYKTSFLQYDGYFSSAGKELLRSYDSLKLANKLVQKTGDIRGLDDLEYYNDRKILKVTKNEKSALNNANESRIKYFYDDQWFYYKGTIQNFDDMLMFSQVKE